MAHRNILIRFIILYTLEVNLYSGNEGTALSELTHIDTLANHIRCHSELRITAQIVCQREHVVSLDPELQTLNILRVQRQIIAQCNSLQTQVRTILNPTVAEAAVTHRILEGDLRYVRLLSLNLPTTVQYDKLERLARKLAKDVQKTKTTYTFDPMPADERRAIHNALNGWRNIKTESIGEGSHRQVQIIFVENK